jgi:hypothetical protein
MSLTPETFEAICKDVEFSDFGIKKICDSHGISKRTFYEYLHCVDNEEERAKRENRYARAKEEQCDNIAEIMNDIADNADDSNKGRLQVDTRKWYLSKIKPKRYGDHQLIEITSTISNIIESIIPIIIRYVPEDKRSEAMTALQAAVDFNKQ